MASIFSKEIKRKKEKLILISALLGSIMTTSDTDLTRMDFLEHANYMLKTKSKLLVLSIESIAEKL